MIAHSKPSILLHLTQFRWRTILSTVIRYYLKHRRRYLTLLLPLLIILSLRKSKKAIRGPASNLKSSNVKECKVADRGTSLNNNGVVDIDWNFFKELKYLFRVIFPTWRTKEIRLLVMQSLLLLLRTFLSLYVATLDGKIVSSLVQGRGRLFLISILWWMIVAIPATFTNSMLSFHQCKLALHYRARLTKHAHDLYLSGTTFYSLNALDDQIFNVDHTIAVDIANFSNSLAEVYSNLAKPVLDVMLLNYSLSRNVGIEGLLALSVLVQLTATAMRAVMPPFGKFVAQEARLDAELRFHHSRLINYSEEIALLNGYEPEKDTLDKEYFTLIKFVNRVIRRRLYHGVIEDFTIKYLWGALGLILCSFPIFFGLSASKIFLAGQRTENFITNRRMLLMSSDAFGRIMVSYKELAELAGYTNRVSQLLKALKGANKEQNRSELASISKIGKQAKVITYGPKIISGARIKLTNVPIVAPNGEFLVQALNVTVEKGDDLLIIGPNGSGKSSLFRILGELWPLKDGFMEKPPYTDIFYVPQRPYLSRGTLRQQIIYPDDTKHMHAKGIYDRDLYDLLVLLGLGFIVARYGGWDAIDDWTEQLSVGVKQRIAMARLFYHTPKYAILDECTSSVTTEMENVIFNEAKRLGITLLTVSHRRSLWKYHKYILQLNGHGNYKFSKLNAKQRARLENEKDDLDSYLRVIPIYEKRLNSLLESLT